MCLNEISLWASRDVYNPELDEYGLYCEDVFNLIENGDFEAPLSDDNWGTLNSGFGVVSASDTSTHGVKKMNVSGSSEQTWHFTVKPDTEYTFAFNAKSANANAKIRLSYDTSGTFFENVIPASKSGKIEKSTVYLSNTNGDLKRYGYSFSTGENTDVYLTVTGVDGVTSLDDFSLFMSVYGCESDPNDYSAEDTGYHSGIKVVDAEESLKMTVESEFPNSPNTGDLARDSIAVLLVLISYFSMLITVKYVREGKKGNETKR